MSNNYPVSEQIARGAEFFEAVLAEIPLAVVQGVPHDIQTEPMMLDEPWGPFTHISLRGDGDRYRYHRLGVELSLLLDPQIGNIGFIGGIHYRDHASTKGEVPDCHPLTESDLENIKPESVSLVHQARPRGVAPWHIEDIRDGFALGALQTDDELSQNSHVLAELLKHGVDFLEGLGSTGLVLALQSNRKPLAGDSLVGLHDGL